MVRSCIAAGSSGSVTRAAIYKMRNLISSLSWMKPIPMEEPSPAFFFIIRKKQGFVKSGSRTAAGTAPLSQWQAQ